ncbi:MAG: F0F1 ATP synthase subunit A, partial [Thiogranum sp.]
MGGGDITPGVVIQAGPMTVTATVLTTWVLMAGIGLFFWLATRTLGAQPGTLQTLLEGVVSAIDDAVAAVAPDHAKQLMPFIGSLWIFLVIANLSGLIPGVKAPTGDLSATAALAILVFLSVHWFGIRAQGLRNYLRHYLTPSPVLLPFHLISEVTRTIALAVRLFGNIISLEMTALLILLVAGFLAPVPILMLH